jgi:hypothetical protein
MKKVIIIEDVFKEFERIKNIIDGNFECPQQYTNDDFSTNVQDNYINQLKESLMTTCATQDEYEKQKNTIQKLQTSLKGYCSDGDEPIYLIDYKLNGGGKTDRINGITFKDKFLKEMYPENIVPVLFITSANHNDKLDVENYVKKVNDKTICDYQTKPDSDDWRRVQNDIIKFINNAQSKPRKEEQNKKRDIIEIYAR